jgi:hypothetical protein
MRRIIAVAVFAVVLSVGQIFATSQSVNLNCSPGAVYLDIADASQTGLDITGNITIETWVKFTIFSVNSVSIATKYGSEGNRSFYWFLAPNSAGLTSGVFCYLDQTGNDTYIADNYYNLETSPAFISNSELGNWVHIAVTVDVSAKVLKFYKNGTLFETPTPFRSDASSIMNSSAPFIIGSIYQSADICGNLKDYRVWNRVRTGQEISANYNRELNGNEQGLVAYWKFNGNLTDETANQNNLTGHNTFSYASDVPTLLAPFVAVSHQYVHFSPILSVLSNGLPELAALKVGDSLLPVVTILDASNNQALGHINFFDSLWTPKKVTVFDVNNDSLPEISVMAAKGDSTKIQSRSMSGTLVRTIVLP